MGDNRDTSEKLFTLEVFVDDLTISNSSLNLDENMLSNLTDTCIQFQFLNYPPLVVCESDFLGTYPNQKKAASRINFKCGKSCFFSLRTPKVPVLPVPFDVKVTVIRKLREGVMPDKLEIGKVSVEMSEEFTELMRENLQYDDSSTLPLSRHKKGTFEIKDSNGRSVGVLTAFFRLSCFGKLIITQFSVNKENDKSYLFKGTKGTRINADDTGEVRDIFMEDDKTNVPTKSPWDGDDYKPEPKEVPPKSPWGGEDSTPGQKKVPPKSPWDGYDDDYRPGQTKLPPRSPWDGYDGDCRPGQMNMYDCGCQQVVSTRPCGCPEVTCSYYPIQDQMPRPPPPPPRGKGPLCDCPYPVPESVLNQYSKRPEKKMNLGPGEVGLQDDQVVFQLPLKRTGDAQYERDKIQDSACFYKLTSQEETREGKVKNSVQIRPDDLTGYGTKAPVGPVSGLPDDGKHDVFLLKIGKKTDGDKKRNLELELRTPRLKEPKTPTVERDSQYKEEDIPGGDKNKRDSKSGKGKKGKKGKKK